MTCAFVCLMQTKLDALCLYMHAQRATGQPHLGPDNFRVPSAVIVFVRPQARGTHRPPPPGAHFDCVIAHLLCGCFVVMFNGIIET